ncbi:MAG TPA: hypothetical protein VFL12_03395, partial [Thermoanaerobaculia bacterium]|nr:hypothetical protein [Thermoanaerobaculia bacterium]
AGARISSSSEKATLLEDCAPLAAASPTTVSAYLSTAKSIESSSETRRALAALVRAGVSGSELAEVLRAGRHIESGSQKAELLVEASGRPLDAAAFASYLECARTIESSSEKGRAVRALLDKATLTADERKTLMDFAEREISSSSEREAVLHAAVSR